MKLSIERCLHVATALVVGAEPFVLDPVVAGLALAVICLAQALNARKPKCSPDRASD